MIATTSARRAGDQVHRRGAGAIAWADSAVPRTLIDEARGDRRGDIRPADGRGGDGPVDLAGQQPEGVLDGTPRPGGRPAAG